MIIPCFRCQKQIDTPNASNADYIIAMDTVAKEPRETLVALKHNQDTLKKQVRMLETEIYLLPDGSESKRIKYPNLTIADNEYDRVEVPSIQEARKNISEDLVKVIVEIQEKDIQKTGVVCPDCYKSTDTIIWGVHKTGTA